jgi:hypothetical protein
VRATLIRQEASRAIRKKLKYGNVHRQLRALVILRALTENAGKGFQINWANQELVARLKDMAQDVSIALASLPTISADRQSLLDPKVKKRLILVFHAWSIQYKVRLRNSALPFAVLTRRTSHGCSMLRGCTASTWAEPAFARYAGLE